MSMTKLEKRIVSEAKGGKYGRTREAIAAAVEPLRRAEGTTAALALYSYLISLEDGERYYDMGLDCRRAGGNVFSGLRAVRLSEARYLTAADVDRRVSRNAADIAAEVS